MNENKENEDLPGMLAIYTAVSKQEFPHTMDAKVWAEEFFRCGWRVWQEPGGVEQDQIGLMIGWFANAIMAGYDTARMRSGEMTSKPAEKIFEKLASLEHERWSRWHKYAREHWTESNVERWDRQADTKYDDLTELEKASDRKEVRKFLEILEDPEMADKIDECTWTENDDGYWETECKQAFCIDIGTPRENRMAFCTYCGKKVREKVFVEKQ